MTDTTFDFDTPIDRQDTDSIKWDKYRGRDITPMWVADMDFMSPPAVIQALQERVAHPIFGYTHPPDELLELVVNMIDRKYYWRISPEWIVWLPGLVTGLNVCCRAVDDVGSDIMTTLPIYPPFLSAPRLSGRYPITIPMTWEEGGTWQLDMNQIESSLTSRTKLFLLSNPHNPTGRVMTIGELFELASICKKHDMIICSDEIHCDLILDRDKRHIPIASLNPDIEERVITLMAPSKTYNLPGLGCAFAIIADPVIRERFSRQMTGIVPYVNTLGYVAARAAYQDGGPWLDALIKYLRGNRDLVMQEINHIPGLSMAHVEATYLAWINATALRLADPVAFFEQAAGVGLSDGKEFGFPGYLRLNFACPRKVLKNCLQKMAVAVNRRG